MNELQTEQTTKLESFLKLEQDSFTMLNESALNRLSFTQECEFAKQQLVKNEYTLNAARLNPESLQTAVRNIGAIGISLNPALQFAYLVPRKVNKQMTICLDISYRGLIKLATDTGIIKAMKAEMVFENDDFVYHGFSRAPELTANPFKDRGALIGIYAMALLTDGTVLVETMTIDEINAIRDDSEAYKSALAKGKDSWSYTNNVWVKYYGEMAKKTVIKRAYKTLPTSQGTRILGEAIGIINQHEGIDFGEPEQKEIHYTDDELVEYQRCVDNSDFINLSALHRSLGADAQQQLLKQCLPEAPKGMKGKYRAEFDRNMAEGASVLEASIDNLHRLFDDGADDAAKEIIDELSPWAIDFVMRDMPAEMQQYLNELQMEMQE